MDGQIIAAIITGLAAILAAVITRAFTSKKKKSNTETIRISNNDSLKIQDTSIKGGVSIEENKNTEITNGEINGK